LVRAGTARRRKSGVKRESIWREWKKREKGGGGHVVVAKELNDSTGSEEGFYERNLEAFRFEGCLVEGSRRSSRLFIEAGHKAWTFLGLDP